MSPSTRKQAEQIAWGAASTFAGILVYEGVTRAIAFGQRKLKERKDKKESKASTTTRVASNA